MMLAPITVDWRPLADGKSAKIIIITYYDRVVVLSGPRTGLVETRQTQVNGLVKVLVIGHGFHVVSEMIFQ